MDAKTNNRERISPQKVPRHVGIIMDGNGRWAQARGLPRTAGHKAGAQRIRPITEACAAMGIQILTVYAFSTENWGRPVEEVNQIMALVEQFAETEVPEMQRNGVRLQLMGRRDGLPIPLIQAIDRAIQQTQGNSNFVLNLALNYGGRVEITDSIRSIYASHCAGEVIDEDLIERHLYCPGCPEIDLVIRTGGEWRLSNFMPWRAANAVFWSSPVFWPDFQREDLELAIQIFSDQQSASQNDA